METKPWTAQRLNALAHGFWPSCALHAACQTGLTAALANKPATLDELSQELGASPRGLGMLLTALVHLEVLTVNGGVYDLNSGVRPWLDPNSPQDTSDTIMHMGDMVTHWAELAQSVREGAPARTKQRDESGRQHFYRAMRNLARNQAKGLAGRLGLKPGQNLLDLGGGPGVYGLTFASETPGLKAAIFDLPQAERHFRDEAEKHPAGHEVKFLAGDFHQGPLGGPYDVVWMSQILHGEGPGDAARVVGLAGQALKPGGTMFIQEFIVDPQGNSHPFCALFALNMLINTPQGQSYSAAELTRFMSDAGMGDIKHLGPTVPGGPAGLMRGIKV